MTSTACDGVDPEIFFERHPTLAHDVCFGCKVKAKCAERILDIETAIVLQGQENGGVGWALRHDVAGYVGGLTAVERRRIIGQRLRARDRAAAA